MENLKSKPGFALNMEEKLKQQLFDLVSKAGKIAIVLPEVLPADALASGLALRLFLEKLRKDVVVLSSASPDPAVAFLPKAGEVKNQLRSASSLVVELATGHKKLDELSYQVQDDKVRIFLKSKSEAFSPEDVAFKNEKVPLDLMVILGCQGLEDLGALFRDSAPLFYETPKINIDNKPGNEYFGAVNLVDVTATSLAEILTGLLESYEQQLIDEQIATCLLAGIITQTNSFQHAQTTPESLMKASRLVALGGRQQEIIKHVYKTKSLPLLKLWGRALARLKTWDDKRVAYSALAPGDFEKTEASEDLLLPALKEMLSNVSGYRVLGLVAQSRPGGPVRLMFALHLEYDPSALEKNFGRPLKVMEAPGEPYRLYEYDPAASDPDAAEAVLQKIL